MIGVYIKSAAPDNDEAAAIAALVKGRYELRNGSMFVNPEKQFSAVFVSPELTAIADRYKASGASVADLKKPQQRKAEVKNDE